MNTPRKSLSKYTQNYPTERKDYQVTSKTSKGLPRPRVPGRGTAMKDRRRPEVRNEPRDEAHDKNGKVTPEEAIRIQSTDLPFSGTSGEEPEKAA